MHVSCRWSTALGVVLLGSALVLAQRQPAGAPKGGFGPPAPDPVGLLRNPGVQKELKLSKEQLVKVDEAVLKALGGVLEPAQMKRLEQITLQVEGTRAFLNPKVQTALKLSDEQKDSIKTILEDSGKEIRDLFKEGPGGFQKIGALRKEAMKKVTGVLNAQQREQWEEMTGAEFQMAPGGFGGGRFGKGGKGPPKKGD